MGTLNAAIRNPQVPMGQANMQAMQNGIGGGLDPRFNQQRAPGAMGGNMNGSTTLQMMFQRMTPEQRREHFEPPRADVIVAGALVLERGMRQLGLEGITAVSQGLRDGVLAELASSPLGVTPPPHALSPRLEKHLG